MVDRFVETERQGWFSRVSNSFGGALAGLLLVLIALPVLFWNEGRAVRRAQDLEHGKDAVVSVQPTPDPKSDGQLVHVTGEAKAIKHVTDPAFGVSVRALKLRRVVEMYQWKEDKSSSRSENVGGSETNTTETTYEKVWSESHIDSGNFAVPEGHQNPGAMPYESADFAAQQVKLGGFVLAAPFTDRLAADTKLDARATTLPKGGVVHGGGVYIGDPSTAEIGDVRITFETAPEGIVTVVGQQRAGALVPYRDEKLNGTIEMIERGPHTIDEMFKSAQQSNYFLTWVFRLLGFLMMFGGLRLAAKPLAVIGSVIPFVGKAIGFGTGLVAFFIALALSVTTMAVAWLFYRPLLAVALFAGGATAIAMAVVAVRKAREV